MAQPDFVGARLRLARSFQGWTQIHLGELVAVSSPYISSLEHDKKSPTIELVEAFGDVLGFAPPFFFRPLGEVVDEAESNFRRRSRTSARLKDQVLARATLLSELITLLEQSVSLPELDVPSIGRRDLGESIEKVAEECRKHWGLPLDRPINSVGRLAEGAGVVLVRLTDETDDVDAFSTWMETRPVVVLNAARESPSRTKLNIGHELGHLVLHRAGEKSRSVQEREAFRFGAALLFPERAFKREFWGAYQEGWLGLRRLKRRWGMSLQAIVYRAHELDLLNSAEYRRLNKQIAARGWKTDEPDEPPREEPELLREALTTLQAEEGTPPSRVARELSWQDTTLSEVAGVEIEDPDVVAIGE